VREKRFVWVCEKARNQYSPREREKERERERERERENLIKHLSHFLFFLGQPAVYFVVKIDSVFRK